MTLSESIKDCELKYGTLSNQELEDELVKHIRIADWLDDKLQDRERNAFARTRAGHVAEKTDLNKDFFSPFKEK